MLCNNRSHSTRSRYSTVYTTNTHFISVDNVNCSNNKINEDFTLRMEKSQIDDSGSRNESVPFTNTSSTKDVLSIRSHRRGGFCDLFYDIMWSSVNKKFGAKYC
ncbi:unnamed protein product [Orchesella dallaii]|uniref:Uncharacterized protein n=1 Tax=Orchesella dallaii TaxID=48710 RepID=A0ABP1QGQ8_9HEXA